MGGVAQSVDEGGMWGRASRFGHLIVWVVAGVARPLPTELRGATGAGITEWRGPRGAFPTKLSPAAGRERHACPPPPPVDIIDPCH